MDVQLIVTAYNVIYGCMKIVFKSHDFEMLSCLESRFFDRFKLSYQIQVILETGISVPTFPAFLTFVEASTTKPF